MNTMRLIAALAAMLVFMAPALAVDSTEVAKAPYLTDAAQAKAEAAESGRHALIYFYSPT